MNIVFFGSPQTARLSLERLLEAGHSIPLVITQPDRPAGRGKKLRASEVARFAREMGVPLLQPRRIRKDPSVREALAAAQPDLNVVVAYGQIIPSSLIYLPEFNSWNLHFSLLPAYRGAAPVQWAILKGEKQTGVTIFELDEKMDEGPLLAQKTVPIHAGESAQHLEQRLADIGADFMVEAVARIRELKTTPQNHQSATYAPLLKKEDGRILWSRSAEEIECQVRAFFPWPSTFTTWDNRRLKILLGEALNSSAPTGSRPGEILSVQPLGIDICCGDAGMFRILEVQPENKPKMPAHAFSLGARIRSGDRLG